MPQHITEQQLETYLLASETLDDAQQKNIEAHLEECTLCRENWQMLKSFYQRVDEALVSPPSRRDEELAEQLLARETKALPERGVVKSALQHTVETYAEVVEPFRRTAIERFARWVRYNPVKFAGATSLAIAALAMLTMTVRTPKDPNPTFAEVKKSVLKVYNKEGEVLWSRMAARISDGSTRFGFEDSPIDPKFVTIEDIDGEGRNVVLVTGLTTSSKYGLDSLFCFEGSGKLRWRIGAGKFATFGKKGIGLFAEPAFMSLAIPRTGHDKPRLFALVGTIGLSPGKVTELGASNGVELQTYHHRGGCSILQTVDIDQDGKDELLIAGLNDGFDRACIAIVDPVAINGHAPVPSDLLPLEPIPQSNEKYYVLLPRTDLGKDIALTPYNNVTKLEIVGNARIIAHSREGPLPPDKEIGGVVYVFGKDMSLESVTGDDTFVSTYNKHYGMKESIQFKLEYWNALKDSVLYWDGEKFVNTPTMNKRHAAFPPLP